MFWVLVFAGKTQRWLESDSSENDSFTAFSNEIILRAEQERQTEDIITVCKSKHYENIGIWFIGNSFRIEYNAFNLHNYNNIQCSREEK